MFCDYSLTQHNDSIQHFGVCTSCASTVVRSAEPPRSEAVEGQSELLPPAQEGYVRHNNHQVPATPRQKVAEARESVLMTIRSALSKITATPSPEAAQIEVIPADGEYMIRLTVDQQSFDLRTVFDNSKEAQWMADRLRTALDRLSAPQVEKMREALRQTKLRLKNLIDQDGVTGGGANYLRLTIDDIDAALS